MNEQLQNTINDALLGLISSATSAQDFLLAEIPEVIRQLLMWKFAESFLYFSFSLAALGISVWAYRKLWIATKDMYEKEVARFAAGGIGGLSVLIVVVEAFSLTWLQIWIAPKVYLIEYAATLVK